MINKIYQILSLPPSPVITRSVPRRSASRTSGTSLRNGSPEKENNLLKYMSHLQDVTYSTPYSKPTDIVYKKMPANQSYSPVIKFEVISKVLRQNACQKYFLVQTSGEFPPYARYSEALATCIGSKLCQSFCHFRFRINSPKTKYWYMYSLQLYLNFCIFDLLYFATLLGKIWYGFYQTLKKKILLRLCQWSRWYFNF